MSGTPQLPPGESTYAHHVLGAAIVCPGQAEVLPLYPEPIIQQDGATKNDCERTAAKRFLAHLREDYPHVPLVITEDALSANAPHIQELQRHKLHFILGVKPGDHPYLFDCVDTVHAQGETTAFEQTVADVSHRFHWLHDVPLNAANGHGRHHLSVIFVLLMWLAFAVDREQPLACPLFQTAWRKVGSKRRLWERLCGPFSDRLFAAMPDIWRALACGYHLQGVVIIHDSS